ncbi:hypothetical protein [Pseudoalteromonas fuliginea]|uniref:hypothetical protein n=1 Tax=Pseudoalteromonas fuliginea TaxID=1872678 RepID=UPI003177D232
MISLTSLDRVVPSSYLAPAKAHDLLESLSSAANLKKYFNIDEANSTKLSDIITLVNSAYGIIKDPNIDDLVEEIKKVIENIVVLFSAEQIKKIKSSEIYQEAYKAFQLWSVLETPIGEQTNGLKKEFEFTKEHKSKIDQLSVGVTAGAYGEFSISVLNDTKRPTFLSKTLPNGFCLVNQDVKAAYDINVSASTSANIFKIGAGLDKSGSVEFDSYYQVNEETTSYKTLWSMFKKPVRPWNLNDINTQLIKRTSSDAREGYRAFSIKMASSLILSGELEIGKSLASKTNLKGHLIGVDASVAVSLSRRQEIAGDLELDVYRNDQQQIELLLTLRETEQTKNTLKLALEAEIEGMDALAKQYIEMLLGKGNELVSKLEEYSNPGQILVDNILHTIDEDTWYKPIAEITLGQNEIDDVIKKLLDDELIVQFNKTLFSTEAAPDDLATSIINRLLSLFGVVQSNVDPIFMAAQHKSEKYLSEKIKILQQKLREKADEFANDLKEKTASQLKPIALLGDDVAQTIANFDQNIEANFNRVINRYQIFKKNITEKLEKAANIKFGLNLESIKQQRLFELQKLKIIILQPENKQVQTLFRCLAIGDGKKASLLMQALNRAGAINLIPITTRFETALNSSTRLGLNIIGFDISKVRDINRDLTVEVDANGNLYVKHDYTIKGTASGLSESRQAKLGIIFGVAQSALDPEFNGAISLEYTNQDNKLHNLREIEDFFDSLDLSTHRHADSLPINVPILIPEQNIKVAISRYQHSIENSNIYTSSVIAMTMRSGHEVYAQFEQLNGDKLYHNAARYLIYLQSGSPFERKVIFNILHLYALKDESYNDLSILFDHLLDGDSSRTVDYRRIKKDLKNTDKWDDYLALVPDSQNGANANKSWKGVAKRLTTIGKAARALKRFPTTLKNVKKAVKAFDASTNHFETLEKLNQTLLKLTHELEEDLDYWIGVKSITQNLIDDLFSKLGRGKAGINTRLLIFCLLLEDSIELESSLFLTTITLSNQSNNREIIKI